VNFGANRSTAQRKISCGVADSSELLSRWSSARKSSVGFNGGSAANAPRGSSESTERICKGGPAGEVGCRLSGWTDKGDRIGSFMIIFCATDVLKSPKIDEI